jgi:DNA polymerase-3 subunit epsilon
VSFVTFHPDLHDCYVLLDLETTGATAHHDRITEVALVRVEQGQEVARWSSLVNPGMPIPPFIERLTGISSRMVADAPTFEDIAPQVHSFLADAVLIAHNVRFDHGFLKNEFSRLEMELRVKTLCTVRLSRKLYPQFKSHGLDAIMQRHALSTTSRHRAMGDVEVVLAWLHQVQQEIGSVALTQAARELLNGSSSIPSRLQTSVQSLPAGPGVYIFYGESPLPLYVGKSVNIRTRVMSHFQADHKVSKEMRIAQELVRIETIETAGELGALLLEARLVKKMQPVYNRQLRRQNLLCAWKLAETPFQMPLLTLVNLQDMTSDDLRQLYGPYRSKKQALDALRTLATEQRLCPKAPGLESGKNRCFAHQMGQCQGVCCGQERPELHFARLQAALVRQRLATWPFKGPIAVKEKGTEQERCEVHVFDQWCHVTTLQSEEQWHSFQETRHTAGEQAALAFDLDTYKLLQKHLQKPQTWAQLIHLPVSDVSP